MPTKMNTGYSTPEIVRPRIIANSTEKSKRWISGSSSIHTAPKRLPPTRARASRSTKAKMTDFWICRDERAFKMATAKQCSAPRHAGIHLQESFAVRRF